MLRKTKNHADTRIPGIRHAGVPPPGIPNGLHNRPEKLAEGKLHHAQNVAFHCFFERYGKGSKINYGSKNKSFDRKTQANPIQVNGGLPL